MPTARYSYGATLLEVMYTPKLVVVAQVQPPVAEATSWLEQRTFITVLSTSRVLGFDLVINLSRRPNGVKDCMGSGLGIKAASIL